ncbi:unnamed protein product [Brachionus calyciflorus]|uniref:G-protein coupled receptors family 1 profile domain-containing protein n=1 Tax=Brachionus calyciflorus TaxID=104777 RepID=A0A813M056_9BILA|nr:unnamed protein product [Brachionus calyciflorus]
MDENYLILQNKTLEIINSCFNISENSDCLYSLLLLEMTRKSTLWANFVLILIGLFTNLLVIIVFTRPELRKQSISIHTIGLAISDIILLCFPVSLKWLNEYDPDLEFFKTNFWCKTHGYFDIVFCCWSAWNVVALSNERWMTICGPCRIGMKNPRKRSLTIVVIIPILSFIVFIWYPFVIETNQSDLDRISLNTFLEQKECQPKNNILLLFFGTIGICLTYLIPFLMILFYNSRIIKKLNSRIEKRKQYFGIGVFQYEIKPQKPNKIKRLFSLVKFSTTTTEKVEMADNNLENLALNGTLVENPQEKVKKLDFKKTLYRKLSKDSVIHSPKTVINVTITSTEETEITKVSRYTSETEITEIKSPNNNNTEILKNRERLNRDIRLKNDRSINIMLITVSITFLALTFPYQIAWIADQINKVSINYKLSKNINLDSANFQIFFLKDVWIYQFIFYTIKDISLTIRNLNFSINFFLYSTMSNLFRKELNLLFQNMGFYNFNLFRNSVLNGEKVDLVSPTSRYKNRTTQMNTSNNN